MKSLLVMLPMQLSGGLALSVGAASLRSRISPRATVHAGFFDQFTENMKQMTDQRVARIRRGAEMTAPRHARRSPLGRARHSHVMLRTDPAALNLRTKGEAYELLTGWKEVSAAPPLVGQPSKALLSLSPLPRGHAWPRGAAGDRRRRGEIRAVREGALGVRVQGARRRPRL